VPKQGNNYELIDNLTKELKAFIAAGKSFKEVHAAIYD